MEELGRFWTIDAHMVTLIVYREAYTAHREAYTDVTRHADGSCNMSVAPVGDVQS